MKTYQGRRLMSQLDVLYRALVDYRKSTRDDKDCIVQRTAIISSASENDVIEITRKSCKIETDWIEAIERGIEFIEKAINEERQFIRSNGEVIPIEKVKRVSKDSVEHLARHSNLLTREPEEGHDVIPDNLYTVERLSDYAVYENRFLYMLLCYLRDFIGMRYERIVELTNTYNGKMSMNKTVVESNRRVEYQVQLVEEKKNDEYLKDHNDAQTEIDRVLMAYRAVVYFLNTPLMNEVSKSPMLKPPITRTNVLRMNRNFREALSLYEYVSAYDKDGYEIITDVKTLSPFVGQLADEIAETVELSSFLTYEHGLNLKEYFKRRYDKEEQRRKDEEQRKFAEQLKNVKRHLQDGEITPEEYIIMLEKRIADLEEREDDLAQARAIIDELHEENDKLTFDLKHAKEKINALEDAVIAWEHKYEEDMAAEKARHAEEVAQIRQEHAEEIERINQAHEEAIEQLNVEHKQAVEQLEIQHQEEIQVMTAQFNENIEQLNVAHQEQMDQLTASFNEQYTNMVNAYNEQIENINVQHAEHVEQINKAHEQATIKLSNTFQTEINDLKLKHSAEIDKFNNYVQTMQEENLRAINFRDRIIDTERRNFTDSMQKAVAKIDGAEQQIAELTAKCQRLSDLKTLSDGRLNALRSEYGLIKPDEDFSNQQMAEELEHQYEVFRKFHKTEWKKTKKKIRSEVFTDVKEQEVKRLEQKKLAKQKKNEKNKK